jgi:hypothetical protein
MPVLVAALVPAAPVLLPAVTGPDAADLTPVRRAVHSAVEAVASTPLDVVVVAAREEPGHLAGFGAPGLAVRAAPGWAHELGHVLVSSVWEGSISFVEVGESGTASLPQGLRVGLVIMGDGSATRGPRAPGGDDARGEAVDAELAAALVERRPPVVDPTTVDAVKVRGLPAFALAVRVAHENDLEWDVLHASAPTGVGYVVGLTRPSRHR